MCNYSRRVATPGNRPDHFGPVLVMQERGSLRDLLQILVHLQSPCHALDFGTPSESTINIGHLNVPLLPR